MTGIVLRQATLPFKYSLGIREEKSGYEDLFVCIQYYTEEGDTVVTASTRQKASRGLSS